MSDSKPKDNIVYLDDYRPVYEPFTQEHIENMTNEELIELHEFLVQFQEELEREGELVCTEFEAEDGTIIKFFPPSKDSDQ